MTGHKRYYLAAAFAACLLAGAVVVTDPFDGGAEAPATAAGRPFIPQRQVVRDPLPPRPDAEHPHAVARVARSTVLYDRPSGKPLLRIKAKTQFGSPRDLGVVRRRGEWFAVLVPELKNGYVAWIPADRVARLRWVGWSLHADRSQRVVRVKRGGKVVRKLTIAVGRPSNPTPLGRYAVTDALKVSKRSSPYGCCVLALTGHQTRLPPGWPGGDRLAFHATNDLGSVGQAASLGCMRMYSADIAWLVRRIPVGSPVVVRE